MAKVTIDNLTDEINKILEEYAEEVTERVDEIAMQVGKKGAQALRNNSASVIGAGGYSKSWKVNTDRTRHGTLVTIYSSIPGLPHLLENGHATRNGGRVPGKTHIKPIEEQLITEFETKVKDI